MLDTNKKYFFIDKEPANGEGDKMFIANGYVQMFRTDNLETQSDKQIVVCYFDPFECTFTEEWRRIDEVNLIEVDEFEYEYVVNKYNQLNNNYIHNQLNKWIYQCELQARLFEKQNMETSKFTSEAMATAYKNVIKLLTNDFDEDEE